MHLSSIYLKRASEQSQISSLISRGLWDSDVFHRKGNVSTLERCLYSCDWSFVLPFPVTEARAEPHTCVLPGWLHPQWSQISQPLQTGHGWDNSFPSTPVLTMLGQIPISLPPTELQKELSAWSFTAPWEKPPQKVLFWAILLLHFYPITAHLKYLCFYIDDNKMLHLCYQQRSYHPFGRLWGRALQS